MPDKTSDNMPVKPSSAHSSIWSRVYITALAVSFFINFCQQMINSVLALYIDELGIPATFCGVLGLVFSFTAIIFRMLSGNLFDMIGGKLILIAGGIIFALSSLLFPLLPFAGAMIFLRLLQGAGFSSMGTVANASAADASPAKRIGTGMGYFGLVSALTAALGPVFAKKLWAFMSPAVFFTVAAVFPLLAVLLVIATKTDNTKKRQIPYVPLFRLSVSRLSARPASVSLFIGIAQSFVINYLFLYGKYCRCEAADYYFIVSAAFTILSRLFIGRFYDRFGVKKAVIPAIALAVSAMLLLDLYPVAPGFLIAGALYGLAFGTTNSCLIAESVRVEKPENHGKAVATYYVGFDLGVGVGALIWGALIDNLGYHILFMTVIAVLIAAALLCLSLPKRTYSSE